LLQEEVRFVRATFPPSGILEQKNGVVSGDVFGGVVPMQLHRLDVASGQDKTGRLALPGQIALKM
jgi:hypothetical protein